MLVRDAVPGQVLFAPGRKAMIWSRGLTDEEHALCDTEGFMPAVLLPAWEDGTLSRDMCEVTNGTLLRNGVARSSRYADALLYLGPFRLDDFVAGLKKYHLFLADGVRIGLQGYDFIHLTVDKPL